MFIRRLNTGSDLSAIITGCPNGTDTNYLIADNPKKELERLAYFANKKINEGVEAFLKVKYEWDLGQRARIIEIVTKEDEIVTIYKFVKETNFDQHILDLNRIKENICETNIIEKNNLQICIIVSNEKIREKLKNLVSELGIECKIETL